MVKEAATYRELSPRLVQLDQIYARISQNAPETYVDLQMVSSEGYLDNRLVEQYNGSRQCYFAFSQTGLYDCANDIYRNKPERTPDEMKYVRNANRIQYVSTSENYHTFRVQGKNQIVFHYRPDTDLSFQVLVHEDFKLQVRDFDISPDVVYKTNKLLHETSEEEIFQYSTVQRFALHLEDMYKELDKYINMYTQVPNVQEYMFLVKQINELEEQE